MRYDSIVNDWLERTNKHYENFLESVKNKDYLEYDLSDSKIESYNSLHEACKECIFSQIQRYKSTLASNGSGVIGNAFKINCKGFPEQYIHEEVFDLLGITDPDQRTRMLSTRDPVAWASLYAFTEDGKPWNARKEQEIMLRCTSSRAIFRCGRRLGKSDALVIKMLFNAINLPDRPYVVLNGEEKKQPLSILVITPRQTHSDNLWRKIEAQIKNSPVIRDSISEFKRYPYIDIRFQNGSKIFIMTAGTGGANAGLSIRSFSADFLILDEGNYLGPEELKAATAILATNADCKLIVSSTPVGIQDFFYDWCFHSPMFKEFHYPTPLLPHWEKIKEGVYQDTQSVDDFKHEFMAEFSPPGHTVFRMDLIQKAIAEYSYKQMVPNEMFHYSIGIDWNSNAGTEIIVVGFNPSENTYIVVDNVNVPRSDWTQLVSCEAVIELVLKWSPFAIIADEGYGGVQIELLRATALRSSDIRIYKIADILTPYQFSSKIEIFDPITKRPVKKSAKPFLVKTAVSRFEEENIFISNEDKLLIEQLSLYQIKSMSNLGLPTYWVPQEDIGDHRLDALMLAIMGFKMKMSFLFENGGSVSEVGYIAARDKKTFKPDDQKKIDKFGLQSLFVTQRSGQISPVFSKKVGRINVN